MAKRKIRRKTVRKSAASVAKRSAGTSGKRSKSRRASHRRRSPPADTLLAAIDGAERLEIGHVRLEVKRAGAARVKRMVYPVGFRWSVDMKPIVGTDLCMHAHVGFLARGEIHIQYGDGCAAEYKAPQIVAVEPGHDGWVVGKQPAVFIEFDFEGETIQRLGVPEIHRHS